MMRFFVNEEVANTRFAICENCDSFDKENAMCKECGCFMKYKTKMTLSECPKGKWRKEECLLN